MFIKELQSKLYRLVCVCVHVLLIAWQPDLAWIFGLTDVMMLEGPQRRISGPQRALLQNISRNIYASKHAQLPLGANTCCQGKV